MKIGYLSQPWDFGAPPDPNSSISRWIWEVSRRLSCPNEALVVAPSAGLRSHRRRYESVQFVTLPLTGDHLLLKALHKFGGDRLHRNPALASAFYYGFYVRLAAHAFRNARCNVIHVHNLSQFAPVIRRIIPQAKLVLHMHCDWLTQVQPDIINKRLAHADAIIGNSDYVTDAVRLKFPRYARRCVTIFNGVNVQTFRPISNNSTSQTERIVYLGRVSPEKGVHVLLDAFERITKRLPGSRLELIGAVQVVPRDFIVDLSSDPKVQALSRFYANEGYGNYLRKCINERSLNNVAFAGELTHDQVMTRLRSATILVAPSLVETFGMPVAEAMASGIPIVASRVGGLPEVVADGRTGILVAPDNVEDLAEAILRLLTDRDLAQRMGQAGRLRAAKLFSWDKIVESLVSLYRCLTNQNGSSS